MLQRIVLYATLGYLLNTLGHQWDSWEFWCVLALFWGSEHMTRREIVEQIQQQIRAQQQAQDKDKDTQ
jgi:hypothetical protein